MQQHRRLQQYLEWMKPFDLSLGDLHHSLANMDHAQCYVNELQTELFPNGTGFGGSVPQSPHFHVLLNDIFQELNYLLNIICCSLTMNSPFGVQKHI